MKNVKLLARADPILARLPASERRVMVEVGVYAGALAKHLLERRPHLELYCVDNWLGCEHQPEAYLATGDVHAAMPQAEQDRYRALTIERLAPFHHRASVLHMDSIKAAKQFGDGSVDLVFIDADHSYEGVRDDIAAWWSKVRPGGWLSGHDYLNSDRRFKFGVNLAVDEFVEREQGLQLTRDGGTTWFVRKPV